jgi:hypothetical protein
MQQGGALRLRQVLPEPVEHRRHRRRGLLRLLAALRRLPSPHPAAELPLDVTLTAAEVAQPDLGRRYHMQIGQRIDQRVADMPVERRPVSELRWDVVADHKTAPPLLDDEYRADDRFILA